MATDTRFRAGGIASGLDTNTLIDQLTSLKQKPLDDLKKRQAAFRTQISMISDIKSKVTTLKNTAKTLGDSGALGLKVTSTNTAFSAETSTSSIAGRYDINVSSLATAARAQSGAFATTDTVRGGNLTLNILGTAYNVTMTDGDSLQTVADNIAATGAPVSAVVLNDGTNDYLSITNRDTGYTIGGAANSALQITESYTGATGSTLGLAVTDAANATFSVNGLAFTRKTNVVTDAVPGTTLTLKATSAATESLLQENDVTATSKNLQKFVDSYNDLVKVLAKDTSAPAGTDRNATLTSDGAVRRLGLSLSSSISGSVPGLSSVRSLVDLGIKSALDGTISIDTSTLTKAIGLDASAVNKIFNTTTTGIRDTIATLADATVNVANGTLTTRTKGLNSTVKTMDKEASVLESRISQYKEGLIVQFSAMEKIIAGLKAAGNYLGQQSSNSNGG